MDYDTLASIYLAPSAEGIAVPAVRPSDARRLRDALEPIATQGWWARPAAERMMALGVDVFEGYVWGRAASLGEPAASVVVSAFGVFEPTFLADLFNRARTRAMREDVLAARELGAAEGLARVLGETARESAGALADVLRPALDGLDGGGRALFSGLRALPDPSDEFGRLWRAAELVREHRGDGHLAACVAAGLGVVEMSVLTELWLGFAVGDYSSSRGFDAEAVSAAVASLETRGWVRDAVLTGDGRAARDAVEDATDLAQSDLVAALGSQLDSVVARADALSAALVDAGAFPPDPRKRAAG